MFSILIVSHSKLADGFKESAKTIFGDIQNIESLGLFPTDDITNFNEKIIEKINKLDNDKGILIFTDLVSASPYTQSQIAISKLENKENISLIGNLNFQMLIEAINGQVLDYDLDKVVESVLEVSKQEIFEWKYEENKIDSLDDEDDDF
ncbi:MAG: PTS sugar transporter subunit IIA [Anaerococcus vaginalis]|nr:PTS sugar transporter subunit IIA [Anaerococcus vaginalis]